MRNMSTMYNNASYPPDLEIKYRLKTDNKYSYFFITTIIIIPLWEYHIVTLLPVIYSFNIKNGTQIVSPHFTRNSV